MNCYVVKHGTTRIYAGTNAEARAARQKIVDDTGCMKKTVIMEQTAIPTAKQDLLKFVNGLVKELTEQKDGDSSK